MLWVRVKSASDGSPVHIVFLLNDDVRKLYLVLYLPCHLRCERVRVILVCLKVNLNLSFELLALPDLRQSIVEDLLDVACFCKVDFLKVVRGFKTLVDSVFLRNLLHLCFL